MTGRDPAADPPGRTALVVDDDPDMCRVLEVTLGSVGYAAVMVGSAQSAIAFLRERVFPIAFIDARLPDMDGWLLVEELRRLSPGTRIIVISGYYFEDDVRVAEALRGAKIDGFLAKPFLIETIIAALGHRDGGKRRRSMSGADARFDQPSRRRASPTPSASC